MEAPDRTAYYMPLPLGELLNALGRERFAVTPETYRRVFTITSRFYPYGLPIRQDGMDEPGVPEQEWQTFRELIMPVIVRSEDEQKRFQTVFDLVIQQTVLKRDGKASRVAQPGGVGPEGPPVAPPDIKNPIIPTIGLCLYLLITAFWLYVGLSNGYHVPRFSIQYSPTASWRTLRFFTDSLSATRSDSVHWSFADSASVNRISMQPPLGRDAVTLSRDSVTHTYERAGGYTVTAYRKTNFHPLIAWIRGLGDQVDADTITPFVQAPKEVKEVRSTNKNPPPATTAYKPDYRPLVRLASSTIGPSVQRVSWLPWLVSGLLLVVLTILLLIIGWQQRQKQPEPPPVRTKGPFFLRFPDQQRHIKPSQSVALWTRQLQQREEGQRRQIDLLPTIRATIRKGGMPSLRFRLNRQRPGYLILIDDLSAKDQQARLYQYLTGWLAGNEVEVETFLFHADPRQCWNATYPSGITLNELARYYSDRRLVILTEGVRFLDYDTQQVAQWTKDALANWINRAILTPVYPQNWIYIEAILSTFFVVLPVTPDGQLRLRDYLQLETLPTFAQVREQFGIRGSSGSGRGIFDKTVEDVTIDDIDTFLQQPFSEGEEPGSPEHLRWWAYATAVYPTTDWQVTLRIGHAIETKYGSPERPLVTTNNLLKLTALPWLRHGQLPTELAQALLAWLPKDVEQVARQAVEELLKLTDLPTDSIAGQEQQVRLKEQQIFSPYKTTRLQALRDLESLEKIGLVQDEQVVQRINEYRQDQQQRLRIAKRILYGCLVAVLLSPFILNGIFPAQPRPIVTGVLAIFYKPLPSSVDSAAYYNNRAVSVWDSIGNNSSTVAWADTTYPWILRSLHKSLQHRVTFQGVYNLHALRYNAGVYLYNRPGQGVHRSVSLVLNLPLKDSAIENLSRPIGLFNSLNQLTWQPQEQDLKGYLAQLYRNAPADSIYAFLKETSLNKYNAHLLGQNSASQRKTIAFRDREPPAIFKTQFDKVIRKAHAAFNPMTVTLRTNLPPKAGRVRFRFTLPRLIRNTANNSQFDSLLTLEADRMLLFWGGALPRYGMKVDQSKLTNAVIKSRNNREQGAPKSLTTIAGQSNPTSNNSNKPVTSVDFGTNDSSKSNIGRGIDPEYGVLVGELMGLRNGNNGWLYLLVKTGEDLYRVALNVEKPLSKNGAQQTSTGQLEKPNIIMLEAQPNEGLRAYKNISYKDGFYPLQKTANTGALSYPSLLREDDRNQSNIATSGMVLRRLENRTPASGNFGISGGPKIFVWGARRPLKVKDVYFELPAQSYEMQDVHMNQGSIGNFAKENAPWQDGGIVIPAPNSNFTSLEIFIYYPSQSFDVDEYGNPRVAPKAK